MSAIPGALAKERLRKWMTKEIVLHESGDIGRLLEGHKVIENGCL